MTGKSKPTENKFAFLFPAGIGMGVAVGALIHNIGVGMALGAVIGTICSLLGGYISNLHANRGGD
jgi:hypothetical protein